ncbi:hypothetical protein CGJ90_22275 [Vibrio parahaemolyticus]|nr:hypothetical protein CGJ90_22275 [Vibrio parahaemolyticus]
MFSSRRAILKGVAMYFWDVQSLKNDIRANKLSEKDKFLYMFSSIAFVTIGIELISISPLEPQNVWDAVESVSYILIVLFGTYGAYKANGSEHGTDFLGRYFSISFVVSVRFCTLLIPISVFLLAYYMTVMPEDGIVVSSSVDVLPFIVWYALLYASIIKHIKAVQV